MKPTLRLLLCLTALLPGLAAAAPYLDGLAVQGAWDKLAGSDGEFTVTPQGRLALRTVGQGKPVTIVRREGLPEGAWTLNLWAVAKHRNAPADLTLTVGAPDANPPHRLRVKIAPTEERAVLSVQVEHNRQQAWEEAYLAAGRWPVQWLQLSYTPDRQLAIRLNGYPVAWRRGPVELPRAPLALAVSDYGRVTVEVASFTLEPYAPSTAALAPGPAGRGWSAPPVPLSETETAALASLRPLLEAPEAPRLARLNALAALALAEWAHDGRLSEATLAQPSALLGGSDERDRQALLETLPLLLASAAPDQRPALAEFCRPLLDEALGPRSQCTGKALERLSLLAPERAALRAGESRLPLEQLGWAERLGQADPGLGLALLLALSDGRDLRSAAWLLPRLRRVAPNYGALLAEYLLTAEGLDPAQRDCALGFAAVQVAPDDLPLAVRLARSIADPQALLTVLQDLSPDGHLAADPELLAQVETLLRRRAEQWQPSRTEASPAARLVRLADFLAAHERPAEAAETLRTAARQAREADPADAYGLRLVLLAARRLKLPEAAEWQQQAIAAAIARDREAFEPGRGSGEVYLAATLFLVQILVKQGAYEEALALARTLNREALPQNYGNALLAVIYALADAEPARLPGLVSDLPEDRRLSAICTLVRRPAVAKLPVADELVALLPADQQFLPRLHLAQARGQRAAATPDEAFLQLLRTSLRGGSPLGRESWPLRGATVRLLDDLSPADLLPYAAALGTDPQLYTLQVLRATARLTGVAADEVWQTWAPADQAVAGVIPWSVPLERMEVPAALRPPE